MIAYVIVTQIGGYIGDLNTALWFDTHPALLIALNPRNRILALTTLHLDATTFYLVGFFRNVLSDPVWFLFGFWYGDRAIGWIERRSRSYGPLIRDGERFFRQAAYPLIFFAPNNFICALSGATGVKVIPFVILNVTGTIARLVVIRQLGETFASPLQGIGDFIAQYRIQIFVISAIAVAWSVYHEFFSHDGEPQSLMELADDEEINDDEDASQAGSDTLGSES